MLMTDEDEDTNVERILRLSIQEMMIGKYINKNLAESG